MNVSLLRQFWSLVEEIQVAKLLNLNDTELIKQLLRQLEDRQPLSAEESNTMSNYIRSKTSLIRELAEASLG
ncbi:MAG: hypothetical protein ACRDEA_20560 [Microcystaceae cyanobacterium]